MKEKKMKKRQIRKLKEEEKRGEHLTQWRENGETIQREEMKKRERRELEEGERKKKRKIAGRECGGKAEWSVREGRKSKRGIREVEVGKEIEEKEEDWK